jgi:hypothetical protein
MLFGKAEVMLPAFRQHHVDFKPGSSAGKTTLSSPQACEHELFAEGEVLQQKLITAKAAASFGHSPSSSPNPSVKYPSSGLLSMSPGIRSQRRAVFMVKASCMAQASGASALK